VLSDVHGQGASGSHMGEKRTQSIIRQQFYWRGMTQDVKHWVSFAMSDMSEIVSTSWHIASCSQMYCSFNFRLHSN